MRGRPPARLNCITNSESEDQNYINYHELMSRSNEFRDDRFKYSLSCMQPGDTRIYRVSIDGQMRLQVAFSCIFDVTDPPSPTSVGVAGRDSGGCSRRYPRR
jgi:hypothetical protein